VFYGEFKHTLDRKGRLIVPSKFREVFQENYVEKFFVTRGLDRCLFVFVEDEWRNQERTFRNLSFTRQEARKFNRLYFSGACEVTCDKQGRILIPDYLKQYAGIQKDVVLVGVSNRIEIWGADEWRVYYEESKDSFEEISERLLDQGPSDK
jgi:MraZ protein